MTQTGLLFCNISWMSWYEGQNGKPDKPVGGGKWVREEKKGAEVCNFLGCDDGYVYGYVATFKGKKEREIKIEKLGAEPKDEHIDGTTVVWTATKPRSGGRRVVGWYQNARVFRRRQPFGTRPSAQHELDDLKHYNVRARAIDKHLIVPPETRNRPEFQLDQGEGWMGHSPWWFPHLHTIENPSVNEFVRRLVSITAGDRQEDDVDEISKIKSDPNLTETQVRRLLQARKGQGMFRRALEGEWGNACAVTGCDLSELLRASHIKPWRVSSNIERLDRNNGLLLLANLDAAFDCGLISFSDSGQIQISPQLPVQAQEFLGIRGGMVLRHAPQKDRQTYLSYHRSKKFRTV